MAEQLSGTVSSKSAFLHRSTQALNVTYSGNPTRDYERTFSTTDVTQLYFGTFTVTTTPTIIDVTNLTDPYGVAVNFGTVKHIQIVNNSTNTVGLTVGGGTNPLFATLPVLADTNMPTCLNLTTNLTVSGSAKNLQLVAASGSISVDVFIVGT